MLSMVCLCVFALGASQTVAGQTRNPGSDSKVPWCNVTGWWRTELGSLLQLSMDGPEVRGAIRTAVESAQDAAGPNREGKVVGVVGEGPQPTIGFSVLWAKGSCTTWVGQCFVLPGGGQVMKTMWLLRSAAENSLDNWNSTRLGEDLFTFVHRGSETSPNWV